MYRSRQSGLTLIELLIGMVLGLTVVGAAVQGFISHINTKRFIAELAVMNGNSRYALNKLESTLLNAGNTGCPADALRNYNDATGLSASMNFVTNIEKQGQLAWYANFAHFFEVPTAAEADLVDLDAESHILTIHSLDASLRASVQNHVGEQITTAANHPFTKGQPVLVLSADCQQAAVFEVSGGEGSNSVSHASSGNNCRSQLSGQAIGCSTTGVNGDKLPAGSEILAIKSRVFYVNKQKQLAYKEAGNDEENIIIDNVENLRFKFGVDTDDDDVANQYLSHDAMTSDDFRRVTSIDLSLLLRSARQILPENKSKECADFTSDEDRYLRSCYLARINVRNRGGSRLEPTTAGVSP